MPEQRAEDTAQHRSGPTGTPTGMDSPLSEALVRSRRFFTKATVSDDLRSMEVAGGRSADDFYRDRWSHDKVVRSTHGVNCTGSCSWKVYVKDGIITWETQQTDYPSTGPDRPEYEPRGCPRGAAFSWYTYSPTRVRYPYVRGELLRMFREAKAQHDGDPVKAWAHIVDHPQRAAAYKKARGKGGLVRASWDEAVELVAAAHVHTIERWGPDRIAGFSPIPAMSMVSHAAGARFMHLIGGAMLSFYDWYADLPVASPQVFGDQTDVPESGDWWDAGYLMMWGSNVPVTRTPDAHWMTEARYRGQKVVVVSPDYADNVKFADDWLAINPGTDAALALAMGQVILQEFFLDRQVPYFTDYVKKYTDLPFLVRLDPSTDSPGERSAPVESSPVESPSVESPLVEEVAQQPSRNRAGGGFETRAGARSSTSGPAPVESPSVEEVAQQPSRNQPIHRPGKFLTAADLMTTGLIGEEHHENAAFRTVILDAATGEPVVPNGSLGHRYGDSGVGKWNLDLEGVDPLLRMEGFETGLGGPPQPAVEGFETGHGGPPQPAVEGFETGHGRPPQPVVETVTVELPRFGEVDGAPGYTTAQIPARRVGGHLVTTVFELLLAQYADYTPQWQEPITGVPAQAAARIAREFACNAEESQGRSMILMGAGTNHWFHSDTIYRAFLTLTTLTGCQGVNGGGWAHYVGQEKVRPLTGYNQVANALDWSRPPRNMNQTAYWYLHTDQFRYDQFGADTLSARTGQGRLAGMSTADVIAQSARLGWSPSYPTFDRNPLTLTEEAAAAGRPVTDHVVDQLKSGDLRFAAEDPDAPENFPRILSVWRSNLLGSSAKGNEYFLKHLLGTDAAVRAAESPEQVRPVDVAWHPRAPEGKLDLLLTFDFRQTSTTLFSDVVLPAATWYEKHDLSSTDMHPYVHSFNPAIAPPWQSRTDWEAWKAIAAKFSELAGPRLGVRRDLVAVPLAHDTPDAMATPHGIVRDWKARSHGADRREPECEPIPGQTMPKLVVVERDYGAVAAKLTALGPLLDSLGATTKGVTFELGQEIDYLRAKNGAIRGGVADGRPALITDVHMCEAILAMSGTTNGRLATQGFKQLEERVGRRLHDLAAEHEGKRVSFADTQAAPVAVITSPEWSGSESGGRRYSPFTVNTERLKPWHTLTGRQHFYLDHDWMSELGEGLPVYRPPLNMAALFDEPPVGDLSAGSAAGEGARVEGITVRYLTPHNKWSIHSEYQDNLFMLSLGRGGQSIWMSEADAAKVGVADNDWIEAVNRNGVVVARAVVSHKMPEGTVYMPHAQDRLIDVPLAETSGHRGGIHNSLTRILIKPTHLIGGYAQLCWAFNYLGPTGNQRDEVTVIRRRSQEVEY